MLQGVSLRLQLSRASDGLFYLGIEDVVSGCLIADIRMDSEAIANLVSTRQAEAFGDIYAGSIEHWGKHRSEHRAWVFPVSDPYKRDVFLQDQARAAVEAKAEGWDLDLDEAANTHRVNKGFYRGIARRWIPA